HPLTPSPHLTIFYLTILTTQGHLWKHGYTTGALTTPLYPDVLPTLLSWTAAKRPFAIFSSGSVQAQLQFFSYVQDDQDDTDGEKAGDGGASKTRDLKPLI